MMTRRFFLNKFTVGMLVIFPHLVYSSSSHFQSSFLRGDVESDVLEKYLSQGGVVPGEYSVDVFVNGDVKSRETVAFKNDTNSNKVTACLTAELLQRNGLNLPAMISNGVLSREESEQHCLNLPDKKYFNVSYDASKLALTISVPQKYLDARLKGYVDPSQWDKGINAAFVNYGMNFNSYKNRFGGETHKQDMTFVRLQGGANLGMWRVRGDGNYIKSGGQRSHFVRNNVFVERDVTALKSQMAVGDIFSDPVLFDGVRMRGVKIGTDTGMLTPLEQGYAPVVRGVARTNATVEIKQNNYVIYQSSVSPGPFEIKDLAASGSNGDLIVTVTEADGSKTTFVTPFSALPVMIREKSYQYSLSAGKYRGYTHGQDGGRYEPDFMTTRQVYGLNNTSTIFAGALISRKYQAYNAGTGLNTRIGAFSADITHSRSERTGGSAPLVGYSTRLLYGKTFTDYGTSFTLAGYRYSTAKYRTFEEHIDEWDDKSLAGNRRRLHQKSRFDANISQILPDGWGNVYFSGSRVSYWGGDKKRDDFRVGYSNNIGRLNYNLYYSKSRTVDSGRNSRAENDSQVMLNFSVPLGDSNMSPQLTGGMSRDNNRGVTAQSGLTGYMTEDRQNYYSINVDRNAQNQYSGGGNIGTRRSFGEYSAGYSQGNNYSSYSLSAQGGVLAHSGGVTFSQPLGDGAVLIEVPGVRNVAVDQSGSVSTDFRGYAVVPYISPYRVNWFHVNASDVEQETDFENSAGRVVPRRGSITHLKFGATSGRRIQFEFFDRKGERLHFGTEVLDGFGNELGLLDHQGRILLLLTDEKGTFHLRNSGSVTCQVPWQLPEVHEGERFSRVKLTCGI